MKKIWKVLVIVLCAGLLGGCGQKAKSEYDIEEFGNIMREIRTKVEEETKYLTEDEINEQYNSIFLKYAEKKGFRKDQEFTVSGCYYPVVYKTFLLNAKDDKEYTKTISAEFKDNEGIFLENNEVIKVKGEFLNGNVANCLLNNCELMSPDIEKRKVFKNNLDEFMKVDYEPNLNYLVYGEVSEIVKLDGTEEERRKELEQMDVTSDNDEYLLKVALAYNNYKVVLTDGSINTICYIEKRDDDKINTGDKIAIRGSVETYKNENYINSTLAGNYYIFK